jgi:hypothetical protein
MEPEGFEPTTSCMQNKRSTFWTTAPKEGGYGIWTHIWLIDNQLFYPIKLNRQKMPDAGIEPAFLI